MRLRTPSVLGEITRVNEAAEPEDFAEATRCRESKQYDTAAGRVQASSAARGNHQHASPCVVTGASVYRRYPQLHACLASCNVLR
eukprot:1607806-Pleurochrysis_carterae.AAC.8